MFNCHLLLEIYWNDVYIPNQQRLAQEKDKPKGKQDELERNSRRNQ